jgi:2-polyprenyl-3-methyl-5-hydroxy-6-metoxy-1,4-benzoquinol methylase
MTTIENHYESLLASRYTWMMGGAEQCAANARALLDAARLSGSESKAVALDLGSGPGYHAKALAQRGFQVIAVDVSASCLQELRADCGGLPVETILGELTDSTAYSQQGPFAVILCVGDTLTHLNSTEDVERLLQTSFELLAPNGVLLLDFREQPPHAQNTIFTTRAERDRIMQCMLQFEPEKVWVTDIVHEWTGERWTTIQSRYPKLRLSADAIIAKAMGAGLTVRLDESRNGRRVLAFERSG